MSNLAEAQQMYVESNGDKIAKGFHYCSEHFFVEADGTCESSTKNEHDDFTPGRLFWVGMYDTDRAFGGPAEGGWWFDYGELVTDARLYAEIGHLPSVHTHRSEAQTARDAMRLALAPLNEGRPKIGSVCSRGVYDAQMHENTLLTHYPATRPHYE
jgi:hypothetical protein